MDASTLNVLTSPRSRYIAWTAPTLFLLALNMGCAGVGYSVSGSALRPEPPPLKDVNSIEARFARAQAPPDLDVQMLCRQGSLVRTGFAHGALKPASEENENLWVLSADPLSQTRAGFTIPLRAPSSEALGLEKGRLFELRALGRSPVLGKRLPHSLQVCYRRPDNVLLGQLRRPRQSSQSTPYELSPPIPQGGLMLTGKFTVHKLESSQRNWRLRFTTEKGEVLRIRYAPLLGQRALPVPLETTLSLRIIPPDPVATFDGLAIIIQKVEGDLIAAISTGANIPSELLSGIEISPSGRVAYSEVKELPSLCVTRLEHQAMRVRSSQGAYYVAPGTYRSIKHRDETFQLFAHDVSVRALGDPCGSEAPEKISFIITRSQ